MQILTKVEMIECSDMQLNEDEPVVYPLWIFLSEEISDTEPFQTRIGVDRLSFWILNNGLKLCKRT